MRDRESEEFEKSLSKHDLQGWMQIAINVGCVVWFIFTLDARVSSLEGKLSEYIDRMDGMYTELRKEIKEDRYRASDARRDLDMTRSLINRNTIDINNNTRALSEIIKQK